MCLVASSVLGRINVLSKVLDSRPGRRQNLGNTVCRRPSGLSFFGPTLAFIKSRWVQTTALCQTRTRHTMFGCKAFYCPPYIFVGHFSLSFFEFRQKPSERSSTPLILCPGSNSYNKYHFLGFYEYSGLFLGFFRKISQYKIFF